MTIEQAIAELYSIRDFWLLPRHGDNGRAFEVREAVDMAISALRAQLEAEKGESCDFCKRYNFANARVEVNKYGAYICLAGGDTQFPMHEQFNFCPVCGRALNRRPPEKEET